MDSGYQQLAGYTSHSQKGHAVCLYLSTSLYIDMIAYLQTAAIPVRAAGGCTLTEHTASPTQTHLSPKHLVHITGIFLWPKDLTICDSYLYDKSY